MLENLDWRKSFKGAFRSSTDIFNFLETECEFPDKTYPVFVPQRLANRIKELGRDSSLWKQFIPSQDELLESPLEGLYDPIGDSTHSQGNGIIHRYKNRILFAPTTVCPVNCRYCFRKNELAQKDDILKGKLKELESYLSVHPEVEEVILTGGDPLVVSNEKLGEVFKALEGRVKYLRIHSRTPMILPERIDSGMLSLFESASESFEVFSIAIHANHAQEFDEHVQFA
ncbi:MAG: 4Fe-4S cluster-binding domain-containing protein, partial [Bacteriovoracaceae bacterium]|nr:4Fe-4S cluster-binding domain-containing protein [Bacteriovoracaceae bacterium]